MADASSPSEDGAPRRLGRYELGPRIATGGMAQLFLARATGVHGFQKYVVVKRILPRWASDREFVEMFLDEARLAAQLDHPGVVHVHDIGEDEEGPFFAMDYIHGQNLLAIIRAHRARTRSVDLSAALAIGSAAAAGLHHAHERRGFDGRPLGLIHRDVSPTNIIATYEGGVKVVDFGIAKATTSRHATRPSVRKGKMAYMSPEQCRGDRLDRRSDVFALGVVLYELITLSRAFEGEGDFAIMNQIVNHDLAPASVRRADVPQGLATILARAVARDPDARYPTARELQRELDAFAAEEGLSATPAAIAAMMEELFGRPPYPWEDAGAADPDRRDGESASRDSGPSTVVRPMPRAIGSGVASRALAPSRGRARLRVAVAAALVLGLASLAWMATRGEPAEAAPVGSDPPSPRAAPTQAAAEREAIPRGPAVAPKPEPAALPDPATAERSPAAAPTDPAPSEEGVPTAKADAPADDRPRGPASARTKRSRARPRTAEPAPSTALPPPFDPDAPAPRPQ